MGGIYVCVSVRERERERATAMITQMSLLVVPLTPCLDW